MKRRLFSIVLCLSLILSLASVSALAADETPIATGTAEFPTLLMPEDKKLVGYQQESDSSKAWVLQPLSESDNRYTYLQRLHGQGYTNRELLYLYPATSLTADITYYTDAEMTQKTTSANGAQTDGGVPDVVGTYYRKAKFAGGTDNSVTYGAATASSPFYVVDRLQGGVRRGFMLSLLQSDYYTASNLFAEVDEPFASVDEGWSWSPASGGQPGKLTLQDFHQVRLQLGVPIPHRAAAFTKSGNDYLNSAASYTDQFTSEEVTAHPTLLNNSYNSYVDISLGRLSSIVNELLKKEMEVYTGIALSGENKAEVVLNGSNQIDAEKHGILVANFESGTVPDLLSLLKKDENDKYIADPRINILGMTDKSLTIKGDGSLQASGNITSPAGVTVDAGTSVNLSGSIQTKIAERRSITLPESALSELTYADSSFNPTDVTVDLKGRVNISYSGSSGIYSIGKISASGASVTVKSTGSQSGSTGLGAAFGASINNSAVTVDGAGSGGSAIEAESVNVTNSSLTLSGYNYGLSALGSYDSDALPANLTLSGGLTNITAQTAALYASDAVLTDRNTDGVNIALQNFYGTLTGGSYAVYGYTRNSGESPVRALALSFLPGVNAITPSGVTAGTAADGAKTISTLLTASGVTPSLSASIYSDPSPSTPAQTPAETTEKQYTDVAKSDWYYDAVEYVSQQGLLLGVSDSEFAPARTMDRAMMVVLLYRLAGEPAVSGEVPFSDTSSSAYYAKALIWAYQNKIVLGNADGTFRPAGTVSRQQFIAMLYRYAAPSGSSAAEALAPFGDRNSISAYAADAMAWAVSKGILLGDAQKNLNPAASLTRAQCAAFMMRYGQLASK